MESGGGTVSAAGRRSASFLAVGSASPRASWATAFFGLQAYVRTCCLSASAELSLRLQCLHYGSPFKLCSCGWYCASSVGSIWTRTWCLRARCWRMVFVEEKYNPQTSHGTPSSQLGAVTGLRELALVVVRACSCSQIPSQYPIIAGGLVMSGSAARSFSNLRLAAVWRLSTGSWTPYFSRRVELPM